MHAELKESEEVAVWTLVLASPPGLTVIRTRWGSCFSQYLLFVDVFHPAAGSPAGGWGLVSMC